MDAGWQLELGPEKYLLQRHELSKFIPLQLLQRTAKKYKVPVSEGDI